MVRPGSPDRQSRTPYASLWDERAEMARWNRFTYFHFI